MNLARATKRWIESAAAAAAIRFQKYFCILYGRTQYQSIAYNNILYLHAMCMWWLRIHFNFITKNFSVRDHDLLTICVACVYLCYCWNWNILGRVCGKIFRLLFWKGSEHDRDSGGGNREVVTTPAQTAKTENEWRRLIVVCSAFEFMAACISFYQFSSAYFEIILTATACDMIESDEPLQKAIAIYFNKISNDWSTHALWSVWPCIRVHTSYVNALRVLRRIYLYLLCGSMAHTSWVCVCV